MIKKDYYEEVVEEIKKLIKTNPDAAIDKLAEELNMPYIPKKYEKQFEELLFELKGKITKDSINNELSKQQVIDILKNNDEIMLPLALAKLRELNLKAFLKELVPLFENNIISNIALSFIYECLVDQEINIDINWNNQKINPIKIGSIIKTKPYIDAKKTLQKNIEQNPSLLDVAEKLLELYSLLTFPSFKDEKEGLGNIILEISQESMGLKENDESSKRKNEIKTILKN